MNESSAKRKKHRDDTADARYLPWLDDLDKKEIISIIRVTLQRYPDLVTVFESVHAVKHRTSKDPVAVLTRDIDNVTAEEAWWDGWHHRGELPDYSGIRMGLETLLKNGRADDVVLLGDRLLPKALRQIERSNDEGMTAMDIAETMTVVFTALKASSLTTLEKMCKAHGWQSADQYGVTDGAESLWSGRIPKREWSAFADVLLVQLATQADSTAPREYHDRFARSRLVDDILRALDMCGRGDDALALSEREAPITDDYTRLVDRLLALSRHEEAEVWIRRGVAATEKSFPGIAASLTKRLIDLRIAQADWEAVAALHAEAFFDRPTMETWREMLGACRKIGVWPTVRAHAIGYLTTGVSARSGREPWPLPDTGLRRRDTRVAFNPPNFRMLLEIALDEKDIDEVVRLYTQYKNGDPTSQYDRTIGTALQDAVAFAVAPQDPDLAVEIWHTAAVQQIGETNPASYDNAARNLEKIKILLVSLGREQEWRFLYDPILLKEKRKPRFQQIARARLGD